MPLRPLTTGNSLRTVGFISLRHGVSGGDGGPPLPQLRSCGKLLASGPCPIIPLTRDRKLVQRRHFPFGIYAALYLRNVHFCTPDDAASSAALERSCAGYFRRHGYSSPHTDALVRMAQAFSLRYLPGSVLLGPRLLSAVPQWRFSGCLQIKHFIEARLAKNRIPIQMLADLGSVYR